MLELLEILGNKIPTFQRALILRTRMAMDDETFNGKLKNAWDLLFKNQVQELENLNINFWLEISRNS